MGEYENCLDNQMPENYWNVMVLKNEDGTYVKAEFEYSSWNQRSASEYGK
jgi:hypothetical protein